MNRRWVRKPEQFRPVVLVHMTYHESALDRISNTCYINSSALYDYNDNIPIMIQHIYYNVFYGVQQYKLSKYP